MKLIKYILIIFGLVCIFSIPKIVYGTVAISATSSADGSSVSHTVTGSNVIAVAAIQWTQTSDRSVTGVTYGANAMTQIPTGGYTYNDVDHQIGCQLWYIINPPTGAQTVSVTYNGSISYSVISVTSFNGTGGAIGATATTGGYNTRSVSITTQNNNSYIVNSHCFQDFDGNETPSQSETLVHSFNTANTNPRLSAASSYKLVSTAGPTNTGYVVTSNGRNGIMAIEIPPPTAPASTPTCRFKGHGACH